MIEWIMSFSTKWKCSRRQFNLLSMVIIMLHGAGSLPLPWSIRMKVALGAAKGLTFLHEEAENPVIYRDFKTSNILLDAVCNYFIFFPYLRSSICDSNYVNNIYICLCSLRRTFYSRITMQNFLILDLPKMVQKMGKLMYLPEWWELMVMLPQSMWWQVSMVGLFVSSFGIMFYRFVCVCVSNIIQCCYQISTPWSWIIFLALSVTS